METSGTLVKKKKSFSLGHDSTTQSPVQPPSSLLPTAGLSNSSTSSAASDAFVLSTPKRGPGESLGSGSSDLIASIKKKDHKTPKESLFRKFYKSSKPASVSSEDGGKYHALSDNTESTCITPDQLSSELLDNVFPSNAIIEPTITEEPTVNVTSSGDPKLISPSSPPHSALPVSQPPSQWGPDVDAKVTREILETLSQYITDIKEKLILEQGEREQQTEDFLSGMQNKDPGEYAELRRQFEQSNRDSNKTVTSLQSQLESLQYRRSIVESTGIPVGVNPKEFVKNLKKDHLKKKGVMGQVKHGLESFSRQFKKSSNSASLENIPKSAPKDANHPSSSDGEKSQKSGLSTQQQSNSKPVKPPGSIDEIISPLPNYPAGSTTGSVLVNNRNPSARSNAAPSGTGSLSSVCGDLQPSARQHSIGSSPTADHSANGGARSSPGNGAEVVDNSVIQAFIEEIAALRRDFFDLRNENQLLKGTMESVVRNMETHAEVHRDQMVNCVEKIERLDKLVEDCNQLMHREFTNLKEEYKGLDEKFNYQLTTTTRDLRDTIDTVSNSLNLVEKRVDQVSHGGLDTRGGNRLISHHFYNLSFNSVAFLMVILSGCFQLLIRLVNFGATVLEHKLKVIAFCVPVLACAFLITHSPRQILTSLDLTHLPDWLTKFLQTLK